MWRGRREEFGGGGGSSMEGEEGGVRREDLKGKEEGFEGE